MNPKISSLIYSSAILIAINYILHISPGDTFLCKIEYAFFLGAFFILLIGNTYISITFWKKIGPPLLLSLLILYVLLPIGVKEIGSFYLLGPIQKINTEFIKLSWLLCISYYSSYPYQIPHTAEKRFICINSGFLMISPFLIVQPSSLLLLAITTILYLFTWNISVKTIIQSNSFISIVLSSCLFCLLSEQPLSSFKKEIFFAKPPYILSIKEKDINILDTPSSLPLTIWQEKTGYWGIIILMGVVVFLSIKCFFIAYQAYQLQYFFQSFLVHSIGIIFSLQNLIHLYTTATLLNVSIPMPFVSNDFYSLLIYSLMIGIVLRSEKNNQKRYKYIKEQQRIFAQNTLSNNKKCSFL